MILLDKPYVSDFLINTITDNEFPVIRNDFASQLNHGKEIIFYSTKSAVQSLNKQSHPLLYSNSENSIEWMMKNLQATDIPGKIELFKDKLRFRKLIEKLYPGFYYCNVHFNDIDTLSIEGIPKPFIIKPVIGFFSVGVYKVSGEKDWLETKNDIKNDLLKAKKLYPGEVLDVSNFIIEEYFEGTEFAFDAYFNEKGEAVILNIFEHLFSSKDDLNDRVYFTSRAVMEKHLHSFTNLLGEIGSLANLRNFPLHMEVRINNSGEIFPIELNPMRFGGWCTTPDLSFYAFGFNQYEMYFKQVKPDWKNILEKTGDKTYSIIVLDNSTGYDSHQIKAFDFDKLFYEFETTLDLRKIDFMEYPVFGFLFVETEKNNFSELENILKSDLRDYIVLK